MPVIGCSCEVCSSLDFRDKRLRSSIHLEVNGHSFVVDTGPDFRQQMLRENIEHLDAIIYTHEHKDHTAGMDDIRPYNFRQKKDIPIYGTSPVLSQLEREFSYVFAAHKYPGAPGVDIHEIDNEPFSVNGILFRPIQVFHHKLPVFGYRVEDFTYITDANSISEKELEKVKGSRILVLNALQIKPHISHFTLEEALDVVNKIQPERAYFTHISHRLGTHNEIEPKLPENVFLAYDGLQVVL